MSTLSYDTGTVLFDAPITYADYYQSVVAELGPSGNVNIVVNDSDTLVGYELDGARVWAPLKGNYTLPIITSDAQYYTSVVVPPYKPPTPTAVTPEPAMTAVILFAIVLVILWRELLRG